MATTDIFVAIASQLKEFWFVFLIVAVIGSVGTWMWYDNNTRFKRFAPDVIVRKQAYYKRKAIARLTDKGGRELEFLIKKDTEYPGTIENKDENNNNATLREPSIVSARARGQTSNGIPIYNFFVGYDFPISYRSASAITELIRHIRENHQELNWLGDVGIIQGIFNSTEFAYDDCVNLVRQYVELGAEIPEEFFVDPDKEESYNEYSSEDRLRLVEQYKQLGEQIPEEYFQEYDETVSDEEEIDEEDKQ